MNGFVKLSFLITSMAAAAQTPCEKLRSLSMQDAAITAAESVPAGTLPAHCRVAAVLTRPPTRISRWKSGCPRRKPGMESFKPWAMAAGRASSRLARRTRSRSAARWLPP